MEDDNGYSIQGLGTGFEVIQAIQTLGGGGVTDVAEHLDRSKSGVHSHLTTLHQLEYLVRDGDTYYLSQRFLKLGLEARDRHKIYRIARPRVKTLATASGGVAYLLIQEFGWGFYLYHATDDDISEERAITDGEQVPLHTTAGGKAILANISPESRAGILDERGLDQRTEQTITDRSELEEQLKRIREGSLAFERSENRTGWHGIAKPITAPDDSIAGAVGVTAPSDQIDGKTLEVEVAPQVNSTARNVELDLLSQ